MNVQLEAQAPGAYTLRTVGFFECSECISGLLL